MRTIFLISRRCKLAFCLIALLSCSDDEDKTPVVPDTSKQTCMLTKVTTPTLVYTLSRNERGLVTAIHFNYNNVITKQATVTVEYDDAGRVSMIINESGFYTYEYDPNGKITSEKVYSQPDDDTAQLVADFIYSYNSAGQLVKIAWESHGYERYEYHENGNLAKKFVKNFDNAEYLRAEYPSYDDKYNPNIDYPFTHSIALTRNEAFISARINPVVSRNNFLNIITHSEAGDSEASSMSYTYNDAGYPTLIKETNTSYLYECK